MKEIFYTFNVEFSINSRDSMGSWDFQITFGNYRPTNHVSNGSGIEQTQNKTPAE